MMMMMAMISTQPDANTADKATIVREANISLVYIEHMRQIPKDGW